MAINPMQRKARQSFLLGMLLMLVISAIIIALLFMQIMNMKEEENKTVAASKTVYVLKNDIKSGQQITLADLDKQTLVTSLATSEIISGGSLTENTIAKIDLGKGAILTQSMVTEQDEEVTDSLRVQEFNMITLPTDLTKNDYIDIRLVLPNGQDYIVISKKRVTQISENTIFIKLSESEIITMSNAIVESYITQGSMLYATKYTDPGIQQASTPTYTVSSDVLDLIDSNSNIAQEAKNALYSRYVTTNRDKINTAVSPNMSDAPEKVEDGFNTQIKKAQEERNKYLEILGETDY